MQATAKLRNVRSGVRKLRLVTDLLRGKSVDEAFAMLSILRSRKKAALITEGVLKSAVANFRNSDKGLGVDASALRIAEIYADGGSIMKRIRPRSQGRAFRIEKPLSHLTVVVSD
jgi:large subunit ribosomal protein L22